MERLIQPICTFQNKSKVNVTIFCNKFTQKNCINHVICIKMVSMLAPLFRGLIIILIAMFVVNISESFSIFGKDSAGKFKCFSTYELVQVLKYDIHYDEVRFILF